MTILCIKTLAFQKLRFACLVLTHENKDLKNACSRIQNFVNYSAIENSRNKDHAKISESTELEANNLVLYRPSGSMELVCNFLLTVFCRQSSSIVFEADTYCLEAIVGTIYSLRL